MQAFGRADLRAGHQQRRAWRWLLRIGPVVVGSAVAVGCSGSESAVPNAESKARTVMNRLDAPLDRLKDAAEVATPSRRSTMVTLRASADRAGDAVRRARQDLRVIEMEADEDSRAAVRDYQDGLEDVEALTDTLASARQSIGDLQVNSERAEQAADDARLGLPVVDTTRLVSAIRRSRRARKPAVTQSGAPALSAPVGEQPAPAPTSSAPDYFSYSGPAFQARLPTGGGWAAPAQSQPTPGRLYRTSVRGPGGLFAIVDYTPFETAKFGGRYSSRTAVGQTAFGSMVRFVFTGGTLPECQRSACVDYIINDSASQQGFAVLAGGGTVQSASEIARTIAESLTPSSE